MVEIMTFKEKILKALEKANEYLEKFMFALNNKNENLFSDIFWHVAAELEYALFIFSITIQDENSLTNVKLNPKKVDAVPNLSEVQSLLNKAERFMVDGKLLEAYKNVYVARNYLLKIQEGLAKKK